MNEEDKNDVEIWLKKVKNFISIIEKLTLEILLKNNENI